MAMIMKRLRYESKKKWYGFFFTIPWAFGFIWFFLIPVIQSIKFSVSSKTDLTTFIGFDNYVYLFQSDPDFTQTLLQSITTTFSDLLLVIIFSIFIASILVQKFRGRLVARAIFFLPVIIASGAVLGFINGEGLSGGAEAGQFQLTVLENILMNLKLDDSMISMIMNLFHSIFDIAWKCGIQILIFMAALQAIPPSVKEAASVEGATAWEFFWKITFPMLMPMIQLNIIYTVIDGFTDYSNPIIKRVFDLNAQMDYTFAAAIAWIYFAVILVLVVALYLILNRISGKDER